MNAPPMPRPFAPAQLDSYAPVVMTPESGALVRSADFAIASLDAERRRVAVLFGFCTALVLALGFMLAASGMPPLVGTASAAAAPPSDPAASPPLATTSLSLESERPDHDVSPARLRARRTPIGRASRAHASSAGSLVPDDSALLERGIAP